MRKVYLILLLLALLIAGLLVLIVALHKSSKSLVVMRKPSEEVAKSLREPAAKARALGAKIQAGERVTLQEQEGFDLSTREGALGVIELLRFVGRQERNEIYGRLGAVTDRSLLPILQELLWDQSPYVRQAAAMVLAYMHDPGSMESLRDYVASSDPEEWRRAGSKGQLGMEEGEAYFFALTYAIVGLGEIGDDRAADVVAQLLGQEIELHGMGDVVSQALAKMGPKGLEAIERSQLGDKDKKRSLADTIGQIRDTRQIRALIDTLGDAKVDREVRQQAAFAMGLMREEGGADVEFLREKGVEEALLEGTRDGDPLVRGASYLGLMRLDAKKHAALLIEVSETDKHSFVRDTLVRSFGYEGVSEAIPVLEKILSEDEDDGVKLGAWRSLKRLTGKKYPIVVRPTSRSVLGALQREEEAEREAEIRDRDAEESLRQRKEYQEKLQREGKIQ